MRPEDYTRRREQVEGWDINIVSYKLGKTYRCTIDNVSPGANIARGEGDSENGQRNDQQVDRYSAMAFAVRV